MWGCLPASWVPSAFSQAHFPTNGSLVRYQGEPSWTVLERPIPEKRECPTIRLQEDYKETMAYSHLPDFALDLPAFFDVGRLVRRIGSPRPSRRLSDGAAGWERLPSPRWANLRIRGGIMLETTSRCRPAWRCARSNGACRVIPPRAPARWGWLDGAPGRSRRKDGKDERSPARALPAHPPGPNLDAFRRNLAPQSPRIW